MVTVKGNQRTSDSERENLVVLGIFPDRTLIESCITHLREEGFRSADISALLPSGNSNKEFAHAAGTKMPEGASGGAASGAVVGGVLGWLAGVGLLAIPGAGPFIAAGPIVALLAGAGVGGTLGGVTGALIGLGFPEFEAKRYEGQIKKGGLLLSVHCDNDEWVRRARRVLEANGAQHITSTSEASADYDRTDKPHPRLGNI